MDKGYEVFCLVDPLFYDSPTLPRGDDVDFEIARGPVPEGWDRLKLDDWLVYRPEGLQFPSQGWKIHVSACLDNAEAVLAVVHQYCVRARIPFKFVRSRRLLLLCNAKYADRASSGKFIAIYPADGAELKLVLTELGERLEGQAGPYILSDLRWGEGPLYVRYGGFAERYCVGADGEIEPAIEDPTGALVPDQRGPTFSPPPWVPLPDFLAPHRAARDHATFQEVPYRIDAALHFSNGGGLYAGVDLRTGEQVVLKEARPYAGLAADGTDAVVRLANEREMLERLAGLDVVPALRDDFVLGEHHFLVQDLVDGTSLSDLLVDRYPLALPEVDGTALAEYTEWALDICDRVERAVAAVHDRGVVIGDLHPSNVLVRPDGGIVLIDFEVSAPVDGAARPTLADPGFMAPPGRTGFDIDRYALACLRLFVFLPLTDLLVIDPAKAGQFQTDIAEVFPVPPEFLSHAVGVITGDAPSGNGPRSATAPWPLTDPHPARWRPARDSMARAILASATPERDDRLFPGDVKQFTTGGLNMAHGAAGVLYALAVTGAGRHHEHEEWLVERATNPEPGTRPGFYDGLHGVAHALDRLDRRDDALKVLDICTDAVSGKLDRLGLDLHGGLAGIGLNLAHFAAATGDASLSDAAWRVAHIIADRLGDEEDVAPVSGGRQPYAGLLRGSSGPALLFLRLFEQSGDTGLLDVAATALGQDLRRCVRSDDGSLEVDEGWRTMPYLADGSVGIGMVLDDYLLHRENERFAAAAAAIRRAAEAQFYIEPGLFYGRAGMILYLSRAHPPATAGRDRRVADHLRRLAWHALTYQGHPAFPGEQLLRLSMDLASGTAGVLLACGAALHDDPVHLPFLGPSPAGRVVHAGQSRPTSERR